MDQNKAKYSRQYLASIVANIVFFCNGTMYGYSAIVGIDFSKGDGPGQIKLSPTELGFFVACLEIGALLGTLSGAILLRKIGRKGLFLASGLVGLLGWVFIIFAQGKLLLLTGRIVCGLLVGFSNVADPAYTAEMASPAIRGRIGCIQFLMVSLGLSFSGAVGAFVSNWRHVAAIFAALNVVYEVLMYFNYETPTYLLMRGRDEEARRVLQKLRGAKVDIKAEFDETRKLVERAQEDNCRVMLSMTKLRRPEVHKPLVLCLVITIVCNMSSFVAIMSNLEIVLLSAGPLLENNLKFCIIVFGIIRIPASFLAMALSDWIGRRWLTISSGILTGLFLGLFGVYFLLPVELSRYQWTLQVLAWTSLSAALFFGMIYTSMPQVFLSELVTPECRELCSFIITSTNFVSTFLSMAIFFPLQRIFSLCALYWIYGAFGFAGAAFTALFIPETKGKSIATINEHFRIRSAPSQYIELE